MSTEATLRQRLLTPGPTQVPEAVLRELAKPIIHHRTDQFRQIFSQVSQRLRRIFCTQCPVLTICGSGTTAFEAAQVSLISPGQKAVTCASGKFGERWQDVYDVYGIEQVRINAPWGHAIEPERIAQALQQHPDAKVVTVVHSETSTATGCDLKSIAQLVASTDAILIVDGITSVGALPVEMDAWGIDVLVAGSQKALMLPPGLGFVAVGDRARHRLDRSISVHCYNLDLRRWLSSYEKNDVPFTPPISLIRALSVALEMIEREGLQRVWSRTSRLAAGTREGLRVLGLKLISAMPSDSVTGAFYPQTTAGSVDDGTFRAALRQRHGIHIAGGQKGRCGDFAGRIFRVSHMGHISEMDTRAALVAIEAELIAAGHPVKRGTTGKAIERFFNDSVIASHVEEE